MTEGQTIRLRDAVPADDEPIVALWQACELTRPWNDPYRDLARARTETTTRVICATAKTALIGTAMIGSDGHRGWLYYLAVDPGWRRQGVGQRLVDAVRAHLVDIGCPKLMLMMREDQPGLADYYRSLGLTAQPVDVFGQRLIPDEPPR